MSRLVYLTSSHRESMRQYLISMVLMFLMLGMAASGGLDSESPETLSEEVVIARTHTVLNEPGAPLGSVHTNLTVAAGYNHACAILENQSIICWGHGGSGRLGDGNTANSVDPVYAILPANETPVEIGAGWWHTCGLMESGNVYCWGDGSYGQMGDSSTSDNLQLGLVNLPTGRTAKTLAVGEHHACVIADNDEVYCWGNNEAGAVGASGYQDAESTPVHVDLPGVLYAITIGAGNEHTCVGVNNGQAYCWGQNYRGQLGAGTFDEGTYEPTGVILPYNRDIVSIAAGGFHTCGLLDNGKAMCWGNNWGGQVGDGTNTDRSTPVYVSMGSTTARSIVTGFDHSCMILDWGETKCWGENGNGQLGDGNYPSSSNLPVEISGSEEFVTIASIAWFVCGINTDAEVYCWGNNEFGQVGNGEAGGWGDYEDIPVMLNLTNHHILLDDRDPDDDGILSIFDPSPNGCIAGTWVNTSTGECAETDPGYYTPQPQMTYQIPCANGTYQPAAGQSSCLLAPAGHYVDYEAAVEVDPCPAGQYQPAEGQSSCLETSAGHYTTGGDAEETPCAAGSYQPTSGQSECLLADPGHHVDVEGATTQSMCAAGTYSAMNGAIDCTPADIGGYVANEGATSTTLCGIGTYADVEGLTECKDADPGSYVDVEGASRGTPCEIGTYQPASGQTECMATDTGHYTDEEGMSNQRECDRGYFQTATGSSSCVAAEPGHFIDEMGATDQTPCPAGSFQNEPGSTVCKSASEGHHVPEAGSTAQQRCAVGTYSDTTGVVDCTEASPGHYVFVEGSTEDIACDEGQYQPETGQTGCVDADMGHHVPDTGAADQTPCPAGTYQSRIGQDSCTDAEAGYFTAEEGMTNPSFCAPGTYQPASGQSSCVDADAGFFVELNGKREQEPCGLGTFQPDTGQASCIDAEPGHYVPVKGSDSQIACEPGTYQDRSGETTCKEARTGHYVDTAGASSQTKCPSGYEQEARGQTECIKAASESSLPIVPIAGAVVVLAAIGFFMMNRGKSGGGGGGSSGGKKRRGSPPKGAKRRK